MLRGSSPGVNLDFLTADIADDLTADPESQYPIYSKCFQKMPPDRPARGQRRFREVLSQQLQLALFCAIVGRWAMLWLAAIVLFDVSSLSRTWLGDACFWNVHLGVRVSTG